MNNYIDPNDLDDIESELAIPDDIGKERSAARWLSLQILYEIDCAQHPRGEVMARHLERYRLQRLTIDYTYSLVNGVQDNLERIDTLIQAMATEWPLDQVAIIDRNILRLAVCEYGILRSQMVGVVIDEAVKLGKAFGADSSPGFINGVLGAVFEDEEQFFQAIETAE